MGAPCHPCPSSSSLHPAAIVSLRPDEYRPENRETRLPEDFDMQFRMEQARGFVWGTQPMIANYHSFLKESCPNELEYLRRLVQTRCNAYKYLGNGVCSGAPPIESSEQEIAVSKISIYAGRSGNAVTSGRFRTPVIFSEGWKASDGSYAVALTNISDDAQPLSLTVDPARYGVRGRYYVSRIDSEGVHALDGPIRGPFSFGSSIFPP